MLYVVVVFKEMLESKKCLTCQHADRVIPDLPPFINVGVDYFGPLKSRKKQLNAMGYFSPVWQAGLYILRWLIL